MRGTALLCNDVFKKKIAVRIPSVNQFELYIYQYGSVEENAKKDQHADNTDWTYIKENYRQVDIEWFPGFTQIQKFELFLGYVSTSQYVTL